ncbi:hypothetical protein [Microcoleus sp.]|uniref:hypothetical protein n=1 Tax=Microcoleus sp. TaxID=44472 RepID=UPI00403E7B84
MPVPQKINFIVEQASCLFIKALLRMVQYLSANKLYNVTECKALITRAIASLSYKRTQCLLYRFLKFMDTSNRDAIKL